MSEYEREMQAVGICMFDKIINHYDKCYCHACLHDACINRLREDGCEVIDLSPGNGEYLYELRF